jgi:hypothetical protein
VRHHRGGGRLSDDDAAWLTVLLQHPAVRDLAWQLTDGHVEDLPLWTDLTRRAHHEVVAAPATLLGLAAWRCGDGALAAVALDRALQADPGHRMAVLLARALRAGMPPSALGEPPPFSSADPHGLGPGRHDSARASHPSTH